MKAVYDLEIKKRHLIDYIYLLRVAKFSKRGIIKLFKDPSMIISKFKEYGYDKVKGFLLSNKNELDYYKKFEELFDESYLSDNKYKEIENMVDFCIANNIQIYKPYDGKMPKIFDKIDDNFKDLIFVKGNILDSDIKSYSICGSRNPTPEALEKTRKIAYYLSSNDLTLINGFARGIDIEAFKGALDAKGRYIGVLGSGIENIYPPEHKKFEKIIIKNGAIISQRLIWKRVNKVSLQMRNRFSSQLSLGTIFIEGNYKSGTKWQLKFAKEVNKPIFYLEPENWHHQNSHVPKIVKSEGGYKINKDLSNLEDVKSILLEAYLKIK